MNELKITPSKSFNRIGFALFAAAAAAYVLGTILGRLPGWIPADVPFFGSDWYKWLVSFAPLYIVGIPLGILIMKKVPGDCGEIAVKPGGKNFFLFFLMCFPLMYGGNIIGTLLSSLISGGTSTNGLLNFVFDDSPLRIVVIVFLAPLLEEFLFRKQLIDRIAKYGEKTAILFSALAFGLFHMNLYQFFYAFGIGLVFGYVYTRTRRLRYTVIMHMIINFMGSVIAPFLITGMGTSLFEMTASGQYDEEMLIAAFPYMAGFVIYIIVLLGLSIAGLIVLIRRIPKLVFLPAAEEIPGKEKFKSMFLNIGTILFILFCIVFIVRNLLR